MQHPHSHMRRIRHFNIFLLLLLYLSQIKAWRPCPELSPALRLPCRCNVVPFASTGQLGAVAMDCDRVVFHGEAPQLPYGAPIVSYSQRYSGQQVLPSQSFGTLKLPIEELDLSNNLIRRIPEKSFLGLKESLTELRLANNLLGDSLNPIFSTAEFHPLKNLKTLDLSGNKIKSIEEGLLKGCVDLKDFYVDRNCLTAVPSNSLNGPNALRHLSLRHNHITTLHYKAFVAQPQLEIVDLRYNEIKTIEGLAFQGLRAIREIKLAGNRITNLNSDVFEHVPTLQKLDLSENFINQFPTVSLTAIGNLKSLNLSSNMLQRLDYTHTQVIKTLEVLDLSRNGITTVPPGTFRDLTALKYLDLSLNSLRTIEDDALEGLDNLQTLIIRDNNILLVPGSALGRLPSLTTLHLDFNRVAALSTEILGSIQAEDITTLTLARNVIRELPSGSFQTFANLRTLDLSGNSLAVISADIFLGLDQSLNELKLAQNRITGLGTAPLALTELRSLDLSGNNLADLPRNIFQGLENLQYLNLSSNHHLAPVPAALIRPLSRLQVIDLSQCSLKQVSGDLFATLQDLKHIYLNNNNLQEINDCSFVDLWNISSIDLSNNQITSIRPGAFVNVMHIKRLNLRGNQLSAFKGEFFNTGTGLEELDISNNHLSYLFPSSFRIHPRLREIKAANNKFSFFPAELISTLQYLEYVDLSHNQLKSIEELDFARLPRLRALLVAYNELDMLSEMAFHNSTQLQIIDLSHNHLDRIGERTFEGLVRLEMLNLEGNQLTELSDLIFERSKLQMLENINLARNLFEYAPLNALQRQYFFVSSVNLSRNKIRVIPADDSIMVNIKDLDLSYNPLSESAVRNILNEPKTVRSINLAGTGISNLQALETPFLQYLNLSQNNLKTIDANIFQRTTLLEVLDLSSNHLENLAELGGAWPKLQSLHTLDLSNNSFEVISQDNFENLEMLRELRLKSLHEVNRIEKSAFKHVPNLEKLEAYDLPLLGYLDVQGILELLPGLEDIDLEVKDSTIGTEQIQPAKHPRLKSIGIRGDRLKTISSGTLAGLKSSDLTIKLQNTSLTTLPPALLFPVPRSSHLTLDITGSKVTVLVPQFLTALEDRRSSLLLKGLATNPIHCDCNARALRRWLPNSHMTDVECQSPAFLAGKKLIEVGDDELTCDPRRMTSTTARSTSQYMLKSSSRLVTRPTITTTEEPMIIWSLEPTQAPPMKIKTKAPLMKAPIMSNDDTLIIGIVGGVVAFIAILIIIICIVRLRMSNVEYHNGPAMIGIPPMPMGPGSVPMSFKGAPTALYAVPPYATQSYATLPHKAPSIHQSSQNLSQRAASQNAQNSYSTMSRMSYFGGTQQQASPQSNGQQPYIIYSDDKVYR
ncbi:chaoptin [Anastrepha ludens]|uniref:chaoptin n=1 Tax=Anastrepha ludens TaxID=28586 RepID=UPI0023AFB114|nr:chaoptin [Anastrepha ludens]XP_053947147.1 chaoptin [Anastrepha ludens]XP_053947148.1 chaoptin [Anastrepha ludens]XP_053947149.1 chaoptin [Anastrepha ludens]XP_053947150.1 chaoptin [Anastrepha ludens]